MKTVKKLLTRFFHETDYSIKKGDAVTAKYWPSTVIVVDVNWALRAAAVEIAPGSIVVWPVDNLRKVS